MFAIIETGGKQYQVSEGTILDIEKIEGNAQDSIVLDDVRLLKNGKTTLIGKPKVDGAEVSATILNQGKDKKKIVFKFKPKTGYKRTAGHRQHCTTVRVDKIKVPK